MPERLNTILRLYTLSVLFLCILSSAVSALEQTLVSDLQSDPLRYQGSVVKVVGEVVQVSPDTITPSAGTYTVLDASDTPISVHTRQKLPKSGDKIFVVGMIYREDQQSKPYIDEYKRGRAAPPLKFLVGTAGVLALVAFILVYLLVWHRPATSKAGALPETPVRKPVVTQAFQDDPVVVLTAVSGPHKGQTFNIYRGVTTIGRDEDQTVRLMEDQTVSRQQARIVAEDGAVSLFNESSTNPTRIDGKPVEKLDLSDGYLLQMGATKLRVSVLEQ